MQVLRYLPGDNVGCQKAIRRSPSPTPNPLSSDAENRLSGAFMDDWGPDHESHGAGLGKVCTGDTLMNVGRWCHTIPVPP